MTVSFSGKVTSFFLFLRSSQENQIATKNPQQKQ